ncbi:hypothetical protein QJS10_CPB13g00549 [Acorus calamus]|uniref:Uncharacterized protein n=1 Tax=Acorus calamus TaxID=4465 RepID=A0AAV9DFU6_ACOCL|nr:hypothetical protein QJS10_CPB13g00549 [Acorus calamus]
MSVQLGEAEPDIQASDNGVHPSLWRGRRARIDGADLQIHGSVEQGEISCIAKCVGDDGESDLEALMELSQATDPKKLWSPPLITAAITNIASDFMGLLPEKTVLKMSGE